MCGTLSDRCCVTLLIIGFDQLLSGNVVSCSICQSYGLLQKSVKTEKSEKSGKPPDEKEREMIQKNTNKIKNINNNDISNNNISNNSISSSSTEMRSVDNNFNFDFSVRRNFKWCWWECKAPYCPYCGILMQPLT